MKMALLGASGRVGQRITLEALVRGHEVKALVRNPERFPIAHPLSGTVLSLGVMARSMWAAWHVLTVYLEVDRYPLLASACHIRKEMNLCSL